MKTHLSLFVLFGILFSFAVLGGRGNDFYLESPGKRCSTNILVSLLVVNPADTDVTARLKNLTQDPLINALVIAHVRAYRSGEIAEKVGSARLRTFNPHWLFHPQFSGELAQVVDHFKNPGSGAGNFIAWLNKWERVYTSAGIPLSGTWLRHHGTRSREVFIQEVLLRMAVETQAPKPGDVPWQWAELRTERETFVDTMAAAITAGFGSLENLQSAYNKRVKKECGNWTEIPRDAKGRFTSIIPGEKPHPAAALLAKLRERKPGIPQLLTTWYDAWEEGANQEVALEDWLHGVSHWNQAKLPLVPLFFIDDTGAADWSRGQKAWSKWPSLRHSVAALNKYFGGKGMEPVTLGTGVFRQGHPPTNKDWHRELLVQACQFQIYEHWNHTPFVEMTLGQPADDSTEDPYRIPRGSDIWIKADISLRELNQILVLRLEE